MEQHFTVGDLVEAQGSRNDPGVKGSWWEATILEVVSAQKKYLIQYDKFVESHIKGSPHTQEKVSFSRIRPRPPLDDPPLEIANISPGDPVDVLWNDVFWEGFVLDVWDDRVSVFFPSNQETYTDIQIPDDQNRQLRRGLKWNEQTKEFSARKRRNIGIDHRKVVDSSAVEKGQVQETATPKKQPPTKTHKKKVSSTKPSPTKKSLSKDAVKAKEEITEQADEKKRTPSKSAAAPKKKVENILKDIGGSSSSSDDDAKLGSLKLSPVAKFKKSTAAVPAASTTGVAKKKEEKKRAPSPTILKEKKAKAPRVTVDVVSKPLPPPPAEIPAPAKQQASLLMPPPLLMRPPSLQRVTFCLDNIPSWVTRETLLPALKSHFKLISSVTLNTVPLDNGFVAHPGYATVQFSTAATAAQEKERLSQLCIASHVSPIPRPLILHSPRGILDTRSMMMNTSSAKGGGSIGSVGVGNSCSSAVLQQQRPPVGKLDNDSYPHFVESDTLEFDMALDWRTLKEVCDSCKESLHRKHAEEIYGVFNAYLKECGSSSNSLSRTTPPPPTTTQTQTPAPPVLGKSARLSLEHPPPPPTNTATETCCIWLKGLPPHYTKEDTIKGIFSQFGTLQKVSFLRDPVTNSFTGHAVVWMESPQRAQTLVHNLQQMVFKFSGTAMPLHAEMAAAGAARGSQSIYDRALHASFGLYDVKNEHAAAKHTNVLLDANVLDTNGNGVSTTTTTTPTLAVSSLSATASKTPLQFVFVPESASTDPLASPEYRACAKIRTLLRRQHTEQRAAHEIAAKERVKLSEVHEEHYARERDKLARLGAIQNSAIFQQVCLEHDI